MIWDSHELRLSIQRIHGFVIPFRFDFILRLRECSQVAVRFVIPLIRAACRSMPIVEGITSSMIETESYPGIVRLQLCNDLV